METSGVVIKAGVAIDWPSPYRSATIVSVAVNGWCVCKWADGREFKARAHWIGHKTPYTIQSS